jgi:hypothetical protein
MQGKILIRQISSYMNINQKLAEYHRENKLSIQTKNMDNSTNTVVLNNEEKIQRSSTIIKDTSQNHMFRSKTEQINSNTRSKKGLFHRLKNNNNFSKSMRKKEMLLFESYDLPDEYKDYFIIHQDHRFRKIWDFVLFLIILYTILVSPIHLSFYPDISILQINEILFEFVFLLELIFMFITTYKDEEETLIMNKRSIFERYFFSWFFYDLICAIPFDTISIFYNENYYLYISNDKNIHLNLFFFKWLKIFRFAKLFKTQTTGRFLKKVVFINEYKLNRMVIFSLIFFILSHLVSCFFVFLGLRCSVTENWIQDSNLQNSGYFEIYLASLYYILVTIYSVGYGDITPVNMLEKMCVIVIMFSGSMLYSFALSSLSTLFSISNDKYTNYKIKKRVLNNITQEYMININLYKKLRQSIKHEYKNNEKERYLFLASLPANLRNDLSKMMFESTINQHKFFLNQPHDFSYYVLPLLNIRRINRGDILISVGEIIEEMYLVVEGVLGLHMGSMYDSLDLCNIRKNEYFGDLFLQLNQQSPYEIKCKSEYCDILVLKKSNFLKIKNAFSSNILDILEGSYNRYKLIQRIENLSRLFFRFCGSSTLVKKKIKQLDYLLFNKRFNFYNHDNFVLQEDYEMIMQMRDEDISFLLQNLDDPEFIYKWETSKNYEIKNIYKDSIAKNDSILNKKSSKKLKSPTFNNDKKENSKNTYSIRCSRFTKSKKRRKTRYSHNNGQMDNQSYLLVPNTEKTVVKTQNFIKLKLNKNRDISHKSGVNNFNYLHSSYNSYYNKVFRNIDLTGEIEMFNREKELNDKTMSIINPETFHKKHSAINFSMLNNLKRNLSDMNLPSISKLLKTRSNLHPSIFLIDNCIDINICPKFNGQKKFNQTFDNLSPILTESFLIKDQKIKKKITGDEFPIFYNSRDYVNQDVTFKNKDKMPLISEFPKVMECNINFKNCESYMSPYEDKLIELHFLKLNKILNNVEEFIMNKISTRPEFLPTENSGNDNNPKEKTYKIKDYVYNSMK